MSVSEFSRILQKHIVSRVAKAAKAKQYTHGLDIGNMRKVLESHTRHSAVLSNSGIDNLVNEFSGVKQGTNQVLITESNKLRYASFSELDKNTQKTIDSAITKFSKIKYSDLVAHLGDSTSYIDEGKTRVSKVTTSSSQDTGDAITIIENIPQNKLIEIVLNYIDSKYKLTKDERFFLYNNLEAGHTAGMFNLKMINTFGLLMSEPDGFKLSGRSKKVLPVERVDDSVKFMSGVLDMLLEADRLSSNMPNELTLFAESQKKLGTRNPTAMTEMQLSWTNRQSGSLVQGLGTRISNLIKAATDNTKYSKERKQPEAVESLIKGIQLLAINLKKQYELINTDITRDAINNIDKFVLDYIKTPSSPIMLDDIVEGIVETLIGRTTRKSKTYITKVKEQVLLINNTEISNSIKRSISDLKKIQQQVGQAKDNIKATSASIKKAIRNNRGQFTSVANLQILLNSQLQQQIKKNMVRPALQNQTGRFAESVKVERLSQSREGMISIFYSYMKNPYATFSAGGNQFNPAREPKTLISKSIREIASGLVGNRLRAISI